MFVDFEPISSYLWIIALVSLNRSLGTLRTASQHRILAALHTCSLAAFQPFSLAALQPCSLAALQPCSLAALQPCSLWVLASRNPLVLKTWSFGVLESCGFRALENENLEGLESLVALKPCLDPCNWILVDLFEFSFYRSSFLTTVYFIFNSPFLPKGGSCSGCKYKLLRIPLWKRQKGYVNERRRGDAKKLSSVGGFFPTEKPCKEWFWREKRCKTLSASLKLKFQTWPIGLNPFFLLYFWYFLQSLHSNHETIHSMRSWTKLHIKAWIKIM